MSDDKDIFADLPVPESIKGFNKPFWIVNTMELFERGAYYGMMAVLARHMEKNLGFESSTIGILFSFLLILLYFVPIVAAALAERYGYRETLIVAFALMIIGYYASFFMDQPQQFFVTIIFFGIGAGAFKPMVSATVAHVTTVEQRNRGYSIYYWLINFGAFLVPLIFSIIFYESIYKWAFMVAGTMIIINMLIAIFIFESPVEVNKEKSVGDVIKSAGVVLGDRQFAILLLIYSGFWFMFAMNHSFLPLYLKNFALMPDWFQTTHMAVINPGTIILLGPYLSKRVESFDSLKMMVLGMAVFVVGFIAVGFSVNISADNLRYAIFPLAIIVFTIGEFLTHPNFISYTSKIAPKDKLAIYMGYVFLPIGVGQVLGTFFGGFLYEEFAENQHRPQIFWAIYSGVGLLTISSLILYHRRFGEEMAARHRTDEDWDEEDTLDAVPEAEEVGPEAPPHPLMVLSDRLWKPLGMVVVALLLLPSLLLVAANAGEMTFYEDDDEKKGIYLHQADVNLTEVRLFSEVAEVEQGETVEGYVDNESRKIWKYEVTFSWRNIDNDDGPPDVRLEVWNSNDTRDPIQQDDSGFSGSMTVEWVINENPNLQNDTLKQKARNAKDLVDRMERDPEDLNVRATYVADNSIVPGNQERLEFTVAIDIITWELDNIERADKQQ